MSTADYAAWRPLRPTGRKRDGSFTPRAKKARSAPDPVDFPVKVIGVRCSLFNERRPVRQSQTLAEVHFADATDSRLIHLFAFMCVLLVSACGFVSSQPPRSIRVINAATGVPIVGAVAFATGSTFTSGIDPKYGQAYMLSDSDGIISFSNDQTGASSFECDLWAPGFWPASLNRGDYKMGTTPTGMHVNVFLYNNCHVESSYCIAENPSFGGPGTTYHVQRVPDVIDISLNPCSLSEDSRALSFAYGVKCVVKNPHYYEGSIDNWSGVSQVFRAESLRFNMADVPVKDRINRDLFENAMNEARK